MTRRITGGRIVIAIGVVVQVWLLIGIISNTLYQRAEVRVPTYPNAANLLTTPMPYGPSGVGFATLTTFETIDSTETVLDFYRVQLTPRGLQHWEFYAGPDNVALSTRRGCPSHILTIQSIGSRDGLTTIEPNHSVITQC